MLFSGFTIATTLLFGSVLGAAITLLHWLRPHPIQRTIVTTLFWRETRANLRPRYLWQRLRAPLSLLLIVLPCAVLLLALCGPLLMSGADRTPTIVVLEADLAMQAEDSETTQPRLTVAKEQAVGFLSELDPRTPCTVISAALSPRVIASGDDPRALLTQRVSEIEAALEPIARPEVLRILDRLLSDQASAARVRWYTTDRAAVESLLTTADRDHEFTVIQTGTTTGNGAILWADFVPLESWSASGTLRARVAWWGSTSAELTLTATADSAEQLEPQNLSLDPGREQEIDFGPFAADGRTIELVLEEPSGSPTDNRVQVRLPRRPKLAARVVTPIPTALRLALTAMGVELQPADGDAELWVAGEEASSSNLPGAGIAISRSGPPVSTPLPLNSSMAQPWLLEHDWENAACGTGAALALDPTSEGITPLLKAGPHVLAALDQRTEERPRLLLAEALLAADSTAPNVAAFPAFVAAAVRGLSSVEPTDLVIPTRRHVTDPSWTTSVTPDNRITQVPSDRAGSQISTAAPAEAAPTTSSQETWLLPGTGLLLAGLLLLGLEGIAQTRRWIP